MNKREERVMEKLWEIGVPMTIEEIAQVFAEEKLSKASIFKAVQSLLDQGYLNVSGVELKSKTYARRVEPAISREEYAVKILRDKGMTESSLGNIILAMTGLNDGGERDQKEDEKLIQELEGIIERLRGSDKSR